jgi:flagellar hook-associated protein 2
MAGLSAPGLGSGLDVNNLVTQLVAAERSPVEQRISRTQTGIDSKLSALGVMRGVLSTLQSSVGALRTETQVLARRAVSSDPTILRATASTSAPVGSYSVEVLSLATTHKLVSEPYAGGSGSLVGTGELTFTQNGEEFVVAATEGMTLAQLRDAINTAPDNRGVRASIVQADDGARMVFTAAASGSAQAINVQVTPPNGTLKKLEYDPGQGQGQTPPMTVLSAAADAQVKIEGFAVSAAGNTVAAAIEGVTLDLVTSKPGTTVTVTVSPDVASVKEKIAKFVTDYNNAAGTMASQRSFDGGTRKAGPLLGDSTLLGVESRMRRDITGVIQPLPGSPSTLSEIGIGFGVDGRLVINDGKLTAALQSDAAGVAKVLAGDGGIAKRLYDTIEGAIGLGGQVVGRTDSLQTQRRDLQKQREALEVRMQLVEAGYRRQFGALDAMLSDMQSTGRYLAGALK